MGNLAKAKGTDAAGNRTHRVILVIHYLLKTIVKGEVPEGLGFAEEIKGLANGLVAEGIEGGISFPNTKLVDDTEVDVTRSRGDGSDPIEQERSFRQHGLEGLINRVEVVSRGVLELPEGIVRVGALTS